MTAARTAPVRHVRGGTGPTVVLVHGLGSRHEVFDPLTALLTPTHEVIAVDLPGFGGSDPDPRFAPGPVGYADWLAGFLADLGVERPHVVGSSMGGAIALELGRRGVAGAVTAFAPAGFWGRPGRWWAQVLLTGLRAVAGPLLPVLPRLARTRVGRAALVGAVVGRPSRLGADEVVHQVRGLVSAPAFAAARDSFTGYDLARDPGPGSGLDGVPVTIAWGTRDVVLWHRPQSRRARAALPGARHVDLPGCGHLPFSDDPTLCADVVRATAGTRPAAT